MPYLPEAPGEELDWTCDWAAELDDVGSPSDTISTSAWAVTPQEGSPQQPDLKTASVTGTKTTIFLYNCVRGQIYQLTNTVVTGQGRTFKRSITVRCGNR